MPKRKSKIFCGKKIKICVLGGCSDLMHTIYIDKYIHTIYK